jgi:hypothetical protein
MSTNDYSEWRGMTRADYDDGRLERYSIVFLRRHGDGWYDEVRYDSHDRTRGRYLLAPHLHIKVRSEFKTDTSRAEREIRAIIETELERIAALAAKGESDEQI